MSSAETRPPSRRPWNEDPDAVPPPEVFVVDDHRVSCDGGGGALGHPKVWYEMGDEDFIDCGYCDRRFVRKGSAHDPGAGSS